MVNIFSHFKFPGRKCLLFPRLAVKWMGKTYMTNDLDCIEMYGEQPKWAAFYRPFLPQNLNLLLF